MINKLNRKHFEQIKVRDNAFVTKLKHSNFLKVLKFTPYCTCNVNSVWKYC